MSEIEASGSKVVDLTDRAASRGEPTSPEGAPPEGSGPVAPAGGDGPDAGRPRFWVVVRRVWRVVRRVLVRMARMLVAMSHRYTAAAAAVATMLMVVLVYVGMLRSASASGVHVPLMAFVAVQLVLVVATTAIAAQHYRPVSEDLVAAQQHLVVTNTAADEHVADISGTAGRVRWSV